MVTKYAKAMDRKRRDFEAREVFKSKGLTKKLQPTGYEAYRVSPQTTTKYGKKYKKIYGAVVEPQFKAGLKGRVPAKVTWHQHGFTSAKVKSGTRVITDLKNYPIDVASTRRKLMVKRRKKKATKRRK